MNERDGNTKSSTGIPGLILTGNKYSNLRSPRFSKSPIISKSGGIKKLSLRKGKISSKQKGSLSDSDISGYKKWSLRRFFNTLSSRSDEEGSSDDLHNQTICEMKILLNRRKSEIDTIEDACKDLVRKKKHYSLGESVNHVWNVYDNERNISGFYKSGFNGNIESAYMENIVYDMAVQFSVEKYFAPTKIEKISPRSRQQLTIRGKKNRKGELSPSEHALELSFQKKIEGSELAHIQKEKNITLFEAFSEYYPSVKSDEIRPIYEKKFIKATIVSVMFAFWDAHSRNIILNSHGFRFFDNARSLAHSNNLIVWGDKMRLPYLAHFMVENEMYKVLGGDNMKICLEIGMKFLSGFKHLKHYLNSTMGKKSLRKISGEWFKRDLIIETFKERIDKLIKWVTDKTENKTLLDLIFYVFPFYRFAAVLKLIHLMNIDNTKKNSTDLWKSAVATVGREDDMLYLVDYCVKQNVDPSKILEASQSDNFSPVKLINSIVRKKYSLDGMTRDDIVKSVKLKMYEDFSFDFKECTDIPNWVVSFLNQYAITSGINLFDPNNLSLPGNSVKLGFVPAIRKSLFSDGYFLTFYSEDSNVYCSICCIDVNGVIRIHEIEVLFDGKIRFRLSKKKHLTSLSEFSKWLEQFSDREFNDREKANNFVMDYSDYYRHSYLINILDYLDIAYIDTDEYEITPENIMLMKEYEAEHLEKEGVFIYIYPPEGADLFGTFELKYRHEGKIVETLLELDGDGNITIRVEGFDLEFKSPEDFDKWLK